MCKKQWFTKCIQSRLLFFDLFGSPYFFDIAEDKTLFRTRLGAVYSLALIMAALTFAIIRLTAWFGHETPQLIMQYKNIQSQYFATPLASDLITIEMRGDFIENTNYFLPILHQFKNASYSDLIIPYKRNSNNKVQYEMDPQINQLFFETNFSNLNNELDTTYMLVFYKCNQTLLPANEKCATKDEANAFFKSGSYIKVRLKLSHYNQFKQKIEHYYQDFYQYLDDFLFVENDVGIQQEQVRYNSGYPFVALTEFKFLAVSSYTSLWASSDIGKSKTPLQQAAFCQFNFYIDSVFTDTQIHEQNLVDLFIIIISFIQGGMSLGILVQKRAFYILKKNLKTKMNLTIQQQLSQEPSSEVLDLLNLQNVLQLIENNYLKLKKRQKNRQRSFPVKLSPESLSDKQNSFSFKKIGEIEHNFLKKQRKKKLYRINKTENLYEIE